MGLRVLVTGGAGFIGSHLCDALLRRGDEVVTVDNLDDFYSPAIKRSNLESLLPRTGFQFIEGDIRDGALLKNIGKNYPLDCIVHLAARAGVRPSIRQPALYSDVNLAGTTNVLELSREYEIGNFVFASSSSVYGERKQTPFREVVLPSSLPFLSTRPTIRAARGHAPLTRAHWRPTHAPTLVPLTGSSLWKRSTSFSPFGNW